MPTPDALDARHDTPWLVTGVTGGVAMLEVLLPADPDLTIRNRFGGTSLIPASERGHVDYVRRVVATSIEVNHVNDLGWTALLEAVILGDGSAAYQDIVRILLDAAPTQRSATRTASPRSSTHGSRGRSRSPASWRTLGERAGRDMTAVFAGFATIGALIALGVFLGHVGLLDLHAQQVLARLAFYVASPALMLTTIADADVTQVLSRSLVATAGAVAVVTVSYVVLSRLFFRRGLADSVIGVLCAAYVNAGNLGIPIAAYVLGDASLVAPTLLMQMLVLQPVALALLDTGSAGRRLRWFDVLRGPLTTPLTVGSLIGLAIALTDVNLPAPVRDPLELVAAMAVPAMLLAYGVSLRLGPRPGLADAAELGTITALKLVVQPVASYALGRFVLDLEQPALLAVTVVAALPTAQNIFVHALRYQRRETLARDSIFITTVLSVPAILVVTALVA